MKDKKRLETQLDELMPLMKERLAMGQSIKFAPRGVSMLPLLRQGYDSVTMSPAPKKLCKYDIPLYQRDDGHYVLHRIVRVGETYTCCGDNQFAYETGIRRDQVIAVVSAVHRGAKTYKVTDLSYQLYCRIWHLSRPIRYIKRKVMSWIRRHIK